MLQGRVRQLPAQILAGNFRGPREQGNPWSGKCPYSGILWGVGGLLPRLLRKSWKRAWPEAEFVLQLQDRKDCAVVVKHRMVDADACSAVRGGVRQTKLRAGGSVRHLSSNGG